MLNVFKGLGAFMSSDGQVKPDDAYGPPWSESWHVETCPVGGLLVEVDHGTNTLHVNPGSGRLIAAAPDMARALCLVEWSRESSSSALLPGAIVRCCPVCFGDPPDGAFGGTLPSVSWTRPSPRPA